MIDDLLDHTLTLERGSRGKDKLSGNDPTFTVVDGMTDVPCAIWPASAQTVRTFQNDDVRIAFEVATEVDIAAKPGDRLVIDGVYYPVAGYMPYVNEAVGPGVYVTACGRAQ